MAPLLVRAGQWTVEIHGPEGRVALGTIVSHDGLIATKASVLQAPVTCRLPDDRLLPARVLATSRRDDLALLRIPAERLVPADWSAQPPAVGTVVLTGGVARRLRAVGIVGVGTREVLGGVLGVALLESNAPGVHLQAVLPGSGAARAGLQPGQQITHLGKQRIVSVDQLVALLRPLLPGDTVQLTLLDGSGRSRSTEVTLGRMSGLGPTEPHQDMSGPLSDRRSGFPAVFQHDSVLLPVDCGGPLIDLQGHVIGVNIARAGREASYAVPAQRVRQWVADQLSNLASADDQQAPPPGHPEPTPPAPQLPVARPTEPAR